MDLKSNATDSLPVETIGSILKLCIRRYFSQSRNPYERPPTVLHVCRRWRKIAINDPDCWTYLNFTIDMRSIFGYTRKNKSKKPSTEAQGKATLDALLRYFSWAKNSPVDLLLFYIGNFAEDYQFKLAPLFAENFPALRSLHQVRSGSLETIWFHLPQASLEHLTHLHINSKARYDFTEEEEEQILKFTAPNLQYLHLEYASSNVLTVVEAPSLRYLALLRWDLQDMSMLMKYPLLKEIAIEGPVKNALLDFRHEGVRRLVIRPSGVSEAPQGPAISPGAYSRFLLDSRRVFPNVSSWQMDVSTALTLVYGTIPAPCHNLSSLTTLSITTSIFDLVRLPIGDHAHPPDPSDAINLLVATFLERLPNIVHLTLGAQQLETGCTKITQSFYCKPSRLFPLASHIIHHRAPGSTESREGTNVKKCLLTVRGCAYPVAETTGNCRKSGDMTFSSCTEFTDFAMELHRSGFFNEADALPAWLFPTSQAASISPSVGSQ
jgi:hypothetical protein